MNRIFFSIVMILSLIIINACSSGKKAYKRGNYYEAVYKSVDRLRRNPDHRKSRETLRKAYPRAQQYYYSVINNAKNSNDPFKNSIILESYQTLNNLHDEIQRSPGALSVITNPQSYHNEINIYRKRAAAERYGAGEEALREGSRQAAIVAYEHFTLADQYSPGYKDVRKKIQEALDIATLKVMVRQVSPPSVQYQISIEFFQDQVSEYLHHFNENTFVRFYSDKDRYTAPPDHIIDIMFDDFVVGQTNQVSHTKEISRDSVVVGQVTLESGKKKDVFGTVKAKFTENTREVISSGLLSMRIRDAHTNSMLMHEKFPGEFVWISRWASFNGDERALTEEEIEMTRLKPLPPPPPQQLFIEFCKPIYSQLQTKLRYYYREI